MPRKDFAKYVELNSIVQLENGKKSNVFNILPVDLMDDLKYK